MFCSQAKTHTRQPIYTQYKWPHDSGVVCVVCGCVGHYGLFDLALEVMLRNSMLVPMLAGLARAPPRGYVVTIRSHTRTHINKHTIQAHIGPAAK